MSNENRAEARDKRSPLGLRKLTDHPTRKKCVVHRVSGEAKSHLSIRINVQAENTAVTSYLVIH
jgi:hypothetical protein